jgi:GDPmannose 4,6-dehydratase
MGKLAILTGICGQDSAYLTDFLIKKDYQVIGLHRRYSTMNTWRLDELGLTNHPALHFVECDINDSSSVSRIINRYKADELYSLAALSHVGSSFDCPELTMKTNADAVINMLESIRLYSPHTKFYQASTSELYGSSYTLIDGKKVQNECTPFMCNSPYSVSKLSSHLAVDLYRRSYGLFAVAGILFNHESPFRGDNFVSRKITRYIGGLVKSGIDPKHPKLKLGNIQAVRDFGYSKEFVECMWLMLQQKSPKDYVVGTGIPTKVEEFLTYCFEAIGIDDWSNYVEIDKSLFRSCEVEFLCADPSLIEKELGWKSKTTAKELAKMMVEADIRRTNGN